LFKPDLTIQGVGVAVSVSKAQWQQSQAALRDEVRRVTTLMRSIADPSISAVGRWNIAEVAMHLSLNLMLVLGQTRQDVSRYKAVVPANFGVTGDSLIPDMEDNAELNALGLKSDTERDLAVLADRIEQQAEEYFGECAKRSPDEPRQWTVAGTTLPLWALTCNLMSEMMTHGYDMARAVRREWRIEPTHAAMVIQQLFVPVVQTCHPRTFVNAEKAADLRATYQVHLRRDGRLNFIFDDGSLSVEEPSSRRVDCHISADPAAFFMMFWQRQSQWNAMAKGQVLAWGRAPWLGLRFKSLIRNP
jgi:SCP-2 sterol transfer family